MIEPDTGPLASRGEYGRGRLPEPERLLAELEAALPAPSGEWDGLRVLVTAGGTREAIDPVRFIGNRSSGRMGVALAAAAARRGADVMLIAANVSLPTPPGVERVDVEQRRRARRGLRGRLPLLPRAADGRRGRRIPAADARPKASSCARAPAA